MLGDSINCILGTGGNKTACWRKEGGDEILIPPESSDENTANQQPYPLPSLSSAYRRSLQLGMQTHPVLPDCTVRTLATPFCISNRRLMLKSGRTARTMSAPWGNTLRLRRNASRTSRLILLRRTALPTLRDTLMPNRLCSRWFARKMRENPSPRHRKPDR